MLSRSSLYKKKKISKKKFFRKLACPIKSKKEIDYHIMVDERFNLEKH